jgi:hypothetical protein
MTWFAQRPPQKVSSTLTRIPDLRIGDKG